MKQLKLKQPDNEMILIIVLLFALIVFCLLIINEIPIAIQSALISAGISWFVTSRRNKTQLVFDLQKEFNTEEMYKARRKADIFLKKNPDSDFEEIYENFSEEESRPIWLMVRFYERLWFSIDNNQVNLQLIPKLFGQTFNFWYDTYFHERLLPIGGQSSDHIQKLKHWMEKNTKEEKDIVSLP